MTARAVADALGLSLDILVVKKIGAPWEKELALGAVAPDDTRFIDWRLAGRTGTDEEDIKQAISDKRQEISEKTRMYRKGRKPYQFREKTVILVDDGAATGATMEAAIMWLRKKHAKRMIVALPVAARDTAARIRPEVSELVVLEMPEDFRSVGQYYQSFEQVSDEEVMELLRNKSEAPNSKFEINPKH